VGRIVRTSRDKGETNEEIASDFGGGLAAGDGSLRSDDRYDHDRHSRRVVQIEPQYRTKIKSCVTEHKIRPVTTKEKIVVGGRVPADVELEAVPADWGPSLTKYRYVYSGDRVMLVDPGSRTIVQEID
jgi:Protein of unknown function (DUF1236)